MEKEKTPLTKDETLIKTIIYTLEYFNYNKSQTAKSMNISRSALYDMIRRYKIDVSMLKNKKERVYFYTKELKDKNKKS